MSSSAYGCVFAGLRLDVRIQEVERTKVRYDRDTGKPYDFKHRAVEIAISFPSFNGSPPSLVASAFGSPAPDFSSIVRILPDSINVYDPCEAMWNDWRNKDVYDRVKNWLESRGIVEAVEGKFGYYISINQNWIIGVMLMDCCYSGYNTNDKIGLMEQNDVIAAFKIAQEGIQNALTDNIVKTKWNVRLVLSVDLL